MRRRESAHHSVSLHSGCPRCCPAVTGHSYSPLSLYSPTGSEVTNPVQWGNQSPSVRSFLGSILGWLFGFQNLWMKPKLIEGIIMVWLGRVTQKSSQMPNVSTIHTHIMMTFLPILSVWLWMLSTVPPGLSFNDSWSLISIDSDYNIHKI